MNFDHLHYKRFELKIEQIQQNCHQELQTLAGQDFACVADAIAEGKVEIVNRATKVATLVEIESVVEYLQNELK